MAVKLFPRLMTTKEVAAVLRVSTKTLYEWAASGRGPIRAVLILSGRKNIVRWKTTDVQLLIEEVGLDASS